MTRSWAMAVSVPGRDGAACQDASATSSTEDAVAVADGLGSAARGAEAARLAVAIALGPLTDAVRAGVSPGALPGVLAAVWRERAGDERALSATLLYAARGPAYTVIGQVGDGLVVAVDEDGPRELESGRGAYGNETECLPGAALRVNVVGPHATVLLATDGVADDLIPTRRLGLVEALAKRQREDGTSALEETVECWLKSWKTPGSHDDRSLAILGASEGT